MRVRILRAGLLLASLLVTATVQAAERPNILVIWGDDIGIWNLSRYSLGQMGYQTPNIDRIANEGMLFTDYYGEQSCTAGHSAFITGQHPVRTGLTKVGIPGATTGLQPEDPKHPQFHQRFGPRGVIYSRADGGIEDSGPLNRKRMETIAEEFLSASLDFIDRAHAQEKPFFVWFNSTRMHYYSHVKEENLGISGQGFYNDGMVEHDRHVGTLLAKLDQLGIADNTIVVYSTDNGPHYNQWPDAAITPYRGEKNTNWEGGYRVPAMVRWPGRIAAGTISNTIMSHLDWVPTFMSVVGNGAIKDELKEGKRVGDWKLVYAEQRSKRFDVWRDPFVQLRIPKVFNLRRDPFERADTDSNSYNVWWDRKIGWAGMLGSAAVMQFVESLHQFPPRQRPASFSVDQIMETIQEK